MLLSHESSQSRVAQIVIEEHCGIAALRHSSPLVGALHLRLVKSKGIYNVLLLQMVAALKAIC